MSVNLIEKARVLVIGAGPAGVGVATGLARRGIAPVILIERSERVGGVPSLYKQRAGGVPTFALWTKGRVAFGDQVAERLCKQLQGSDVEVWLETQAIEISPARMRATLVNPSRGIFQVSAEAVVLACGAREKTGVERGWVYGSRPSGLLFTKNLIDLSDRHEVHFRSRPVILGSDLIAFAVAAKLRSAGASDVVMVDRSPRPACSLPARFYFRRWARPHYQGGAHAVTVAGTHSISCLIWTNGARVSADLLIMCGELVPNTELAVMGNLQVDHASHRVSVGSSYQLSEQGWFVAGNILGSYHGAEWCYFNGRRVAHHVANYLRRVHAPAE